MLYESDSSMQDEPVPQHDGEELLSNHSLTSNQGNGRKSQEIFTIQIQPDLSGSVNFESSLNGKSKRSSGYVSLNISDSCDEGDIQEEENGELCVASVVEHSENEPLTDPECGSLPGASCSRSSSKSNITIFKINKTLCAKVDHPQRSHRSSKKRRIGGARKKRRLADDNEDFSDFEDSDDGITLTSRSRSRSRFAVGYDPGGSGFLSMWSAAYSDLIYDYEGLSWDCCVALVIAFCASAQCKAYTQAMKMAAWFIVVVLVFMSFKHYYYGTAFHGYSYKMSQSQTETDHHDQFMDIVDAEDYGER